MEEKLLMTPEDVKKLIGMIAQDRQLAAQLWKAMVGDEGNVRVLIDALHEAVRNGSRLPKS
jgi:hypothetical protein